MRKAIGVLAVWVSLALATHATRAQTTFALERLTLPLDRLAVAGCVLSPTPSVRMSGDRVRSGLWAGLPITSNPWVGTDRKTVVAIRERVVSSPAPPDGPPLSGPELARFRLQLADDIEDAYAAIYADASFNLVAVHAVRFKNTAQPVRERTRRPERNYIDLGRTVVVVSGEDSNCFEAVRTHLAAVTGR